MSGEVALRDDHAVELAEMLEFLRHLIDFAPDALREPLERFTAGGYTLDELRGDLARFALLLGGDGYGRFADGR